MKKDLVSILITNYNKANFLKKALNLVWDKLTSIKKLFYLMIYHLTNLIKF